MEQKNQNIRISISGMHCRSCELLLEEAIGEVPGVSRVEVSEKKGEAQIWFAHQRPDQEGLRRAIEKSGYAIGVASKRPWISKNPSEYLELFIASGSVFIIYAILRVTGLLTKTVAFSDRPTYGVVMLIGLVAGVSTCMALIGGLVLAASGAHAKKHPEATRLQKFRPHLFFNLGRVFGFAILGGLIGLAGSALRITGGTLSILVFLVGAVMLFLGLKLIGIFPRIEGATISLPKSISRFLGIKQEVKEYSTRGVFITGALTFFLPCGFTQAMQIYAISTGSFLSGALIMGLFALGTAPGLLGIGGLSSIAKGSWGRVFFKFAGVLVIVFGLINVRSGWNLSGLVSSSQQPGEVATAPIEDGFQVIRMTQKVNGYSPRQFTIKKGVPVRWIVNSENAYTCAAFLTIPAYNLFTPLKDGENIIEFTPQESGPLRFSCSMGMYSGVFNVVE
jgi:sulfite exporter TauE/SafE/copper chaperone CopZ